MHQIGSIRWSNDGREQQGTPEKAWEYHKTGSYGSSSQPSSSIPTSPHDAVCRIGTDKPTAISKINNPAFLVLHLCILLSVALLFGTGSEEDNLCFLSKFPDTFWAFGMRSKRA